jgi:hypothetical protein
MIINRPGQVSSYAREDGGTGLEFACTVPAVLPAAITGGDNRKLWRGEANGGAG